MSLAWCPSTCFTVNGFEMAGVSGGTPGGHADPDARLSRWRLRKVGLRGDLRRLHRNTKQPPLVVDILEQQIELDLQRLGRTTPRKTQHPLVIEGGRPFELRRHQRYREQIDMPPAQVREDEREIGGGVLALKTRGCEITQHGIVAGTVGIVERQ